MAWRRSSVDAVHAAAVPLISSGGPRPPASGRARYRFAWWGLRFLAVPWPGGGS